MFDLSLVLWQSTVSARVIAIGGVMQLIGPGVAGFTYGTIGGATFPALAPSLIGALLGVGGVAACAWLPTRNKPAVSSTAEPAGAAAAANAKAPPTNAWRLVLCTPMARIVNLRAVNGLVVFASFDVLPLWAIASLSAGGLALTEKELGTCLLPTACLLPASYCLPPPCHVAGLLLSGSAVAFFIYSTWLMGRVVERCGIRPSFVHCSLLSACVLQLLPFGRLLVPPHGPTGIGVLILSAALHATFQCLGVTAAVACISGTNNEFAAHPQLKGRLNGVVSTIEAIGKLLGPLLMAPLLAALIAARPLVVNPPRGVVTAGAESRGASSAKPLWLELLGSGAFATFGVVTALLLLSALAAHCLLPSSVDAPPPPPPRALRGVEPAAADCAGTELPPAAALPPTTTERVRQCNTST